MTDAVRCLRERSVRPHLPTRACVGGIGTVSGRAPLAPRGLPGFKGPFPSTSLDKGDMQLAGAQAMVAELRRGRGAAPALGVCARLLRRCRGAAPALRVYARLLLRGRGAAPALRVCARL